MSGTRATDGGRCGGVVADVLMKAVTLMALFILLTVLLGERQRGIGLSARGLTASQVGTRGTVHTGDIFLSGVDRRVHAPLGTLSNFSSLLARRKLSSRAHHRYGRIVRRGSRLLLGLVGSIVSLSDLRFNGLRFYVTRRSTMDVYEGIVSAIGGIGRARTRLAFAARLRRVPVRASSSHLRRILVGLLVGTAGFAPRNDVILGLRGRASSAMLFAMASANYNVPGSGRTGVFRHFRGLGRGTRNDKLKLSVYRLVVRRVNKRV